MNARTNTFNFPFRETNNHQAYASTNVRKILDTIAPPVFTSVEAETANSFPVSHQQIQDMAIPTKATMKYDPLGYCRPSVLYMIFVTPVTIKP